MWCVWRAPIPPPTRSTQTRRPSRTTKRIESGPVANDPIKQFHIEPLIPIEVAGLDASFTNASLAMVAGVGLAALFFNRAMKPAALVPNRAQVVAEGAYGFIHGMVHQTTGDEGVKKFFPFVFTLFLFIFMSNMLGMFPGFLGVPHVFAPTSQIIVTGAMAVLVFLTVIVVGFAKNGLKFLNVFAPSGLHPLMYLFIVPIEVVSFFSRPLSHAVRLWANIFAGHLLLKVIAGFVPMMAAGGLALTALSVVPLILVVAIYALEFLVAFLQAYVFAMLTCVYLNDALHPGH
ncbi:MAG: F0F1 ATP synthase subunit A [Hyphomonadaceae bacterium]|nr:F0F1 ATP synthase subunit A [Hyphomonadaceae bacterium]